MNVRILVFPDSGESRVLGSCTRLPNLESQCLSVTPMSLWPQHPPSAWPSTEDFEAGFLQLFYFYWWKLFYNVVLVSVAQQSELVFRLKFSEPPSCTPETVFVILPPAKKNGFYWVKSVSCKGYCFVFFCCCFFTPKCSSKNGKKNLLNKWCWNNWISLGGGGGKWNLTLAHRVK